MGANGPSEIKQHLWLKDMDWDQLLAKKFPSPLTVDVPSPTF